MVTENFIILKSETKFNPNTGEFQLDAASNPFVLQKIEKIITQCIVKIFSKSQQKNLHFSFKGLIKKFEGQTYFCTHFTFEYCANNQEDFVDNIVDDAWKQIYETFRNLPKNIEDLLKVNTLKPEKICIIVGSEVNEGKTFSVKTEIEKFLLDELRKLTTFRLPYFEIILPDGTIVKVTLEDIAKKSRSTFKNQIKVIGSINGISDNTHLTSINSSVGKSIPIQMSTHYSKFKSPLIDAFHNGHTLKFLVYPTVEFKAGQMKNVAYEFKALESFGQRDIDETKPK